MKLNLSYRPTAKETFMYSSSKVLSIYNYLGNKVCLYVVLYTMHVISQTIDGGAREADGGTSAPV